MMDDTRRHPPETDDPIFDRVKRAADEAAEEVLEEDRLLREAGIEPETRSS